MKILWLALGIPLAIVVITIIANSIPSFDYRRKGGTQNPNPAAAPRRNFRPNWLIIILVGLLIAGGFWTMKNHSSSVYPVASDAQDIWPHIGETVKVKICPDRLSGWINLPPGAKFLVDALGEVECFFWSGERIFIKDKNTQWLGEVPNCSFRMRGAKGEATITIQ